MLPVPALFAAGSSGFGPSARSSLCRIGVTCAVLLFLSLTGARAQDVRLGVRVGPTFGFLNDRPIPFISEKGVTEANTNVRLDFHAGVHAVVPLSDRYALQPELLFVQKGGHLSRDGGGVYASERYRLSYLQAHLLGRRHTSLPGPLSLHAVLGPTLGVATGGAVRYDLRSRTFAVNESIDLLEGELIRRWDVGVLLGVGLAYPVSTAGSVSLDLRYNAGFRSVFTDTRRPRSERQPYMNDPPPLSRTPPPLRHDVIMASLSFTMSLSSL